MRQRTPTTPNVAIWKPLKEFAKMHKDEFGAVRHAMSMNDLRELYKRLENFIADCTRNEVDENRDAINGVLTLVHKRMVDFLQNK